jgi:hypothetical protein
MAGESVDEIESLRWSAEIAGMNNQLIAVWDLLSKSSEEYTDLRRGLPLKTSTIRDLCIL